MPRQKRNAAAEAAPEAQTPADPFAYILTDLREVAGGPCSECGGFKSKIAPLAKEIGVPPVTLSDYLRGRKQVGRVTLTRFINFLSNRSTETPEQAEALAEVASLD